jgi:hypothetical protein
VHISEHAGFRTDETIIRAVSRHDVVIRRRELFAVGAVEA